MIFCHYFIQHCFICRPSDSTVSEEVGIDPRSVMTSALAIRRFNHSGRSHPPRLYLINRRLDPQSTVYMQSAFHSSRPNRLHPPPHPQARRGDPLDGGGGGPGGVGGGAHSDEGTRRLWYSRDIKYNPSTAKSTHKLGKISSTCG